MRNGQGKALYKREKDSLEVPQEEAEIQRRIKPKEKLGFQPRYVFSEGKNAVDGDPNKSWSGVEAKGELNRRRWDWRLA